MNGPVLLGWTLLQFSWDGLDAQRREKIRSLKWLYIDAYAGPGYHLSKTSGNRVEGSPLIALNTSPPFAEYHFIDTEPKRAEQLRTLAGNRSDVFTYSQDCNTSCYATSFRAKFSDYRRALCLLDPYNIDLTFAFFFKQWGGVQKSKTGRTLEGRTWDQMPEQHALMLA